MTLSVKIARLHPEAIIPLYATPGDGAMDLFATTRKHDSLKSQVTYGTGLVFEIPAGYVGLVYPRSSVVHKGVRLANAVGVIDAGYRGEVTLVFDMAGIPRGQPYGIGDRIGQLIIMPRPEVKFQEVSTDELSDSVRGNGSYGSTGK